MLERRIREVVNNDGMQIAFMPGRGMTDTLYMCFRDTEKTFDRVPRKLMEWVIRKKK